MHDIYKCILYIVVCIFQNILELIPRCIESSIYSNYGAIPHIEIFLSATCYSAVNIIRIVRRTEVPAHNVKKQDENRHVNMRVCVKASR